MTAVQTLVRRTPVVEIKGRRAPTRTAAREAADRLFKKRATELFEVEAPAKRAPVILLDNSKAPVVAELTEHQKAFRLAREGKFEEAARIAARLINAGQGDGFLVYGNSADYQKAVAWHATRIADDQPHANVHVLSPERAQVLLLNNSGNRRVKSANLAKIMRDIASGRFQVNGESIIVCDDGSVNDGQHRCFGVVVTGIPIETVVAYGVSKASMKTVDIGDKRQAKDRLAVAGVSDYIRMSAIASFAFEIYNGRPSTPSEADEYFHQNREMIEKAGSLTFSNMRGVGPAAAGTAAMHLLRMGYDADSIKAFFSKIRSGEMLAKNDPRMTLHRAIFVDKYKLKLSRDNWLRALVYHFIALQEGRKPTEVQFSKPLPEIA